MSRKINIPSAIAKIEELLAKVREAVSGETTKPSEKRGLCGGKKDPIKEPKKRGRKPSTEKKSPKAKKEEKNTPKKRGEKQKPVRVTPDGSKKVVKHSRLRAVKRVKIDESANQFATKKTGKKHK
jgi:hypothetical protein